MPSLVARTGTEGGITLVAVFLPLFGATFFEAFFGAVFFFATIPIPLEALVEGDGVTDGRLSQAPLFYSP
jgi:hypothetical protein